MAEIVNSSPFLSRRNSDDASAIKLNALLAAAASDLPWGVSDTFRCSRHAPIAADVRARTLYLVQIGYISMQAEEDLELRLRRIPEYVSIFTGIAPQQREIERFRSRHRPG